MLTGTAKHSFQKDLEAPQGGGGHTWRRGAWWETSTGVSVKKGEGMGKAHSRDITSQGGRGTRQEKAPALVE